jgi:MFS transporter, DHA1 family, multidrug resistance protein
MTVPDQQPTEAVRRRKPPLLLLVALTAVPSLSTNVFIPSMPGLVQHFGTDGATVQLTITLYLVTLGVGQLLYGPLSDRFGRRPVLLGGLVIYVIGSALCLAAPSIETLVLARVVQAAGGCAGFILARAMIRDLYQRDRAASMLGYVTMSMAIATAGAPAAGAFLDVWQGWRSSFFMMTCMGVVLALSAYWLSGETLATRVPFPSPGPMLRLYASVLKAARFQRFGGYTIGTIASYYAFVSGGAFVVIDLYQQSPTTFGVYYVFASLAYIAGNFLAGGWTERIGVERMTRLGGMLVALCGVALIALVFADFRHPAVIFVPLSLSYFGAGISQPGATIGAIEAAPRNIGACAGLLGALQLAASALASLVIGLTQHWGALPFALVCGGLMIAAQVNLMWPRRAA